MKLTLHATEFAARAHAGQVRKYTGHPYIWHPINVAVKLAAYTNDQEMIAAALLHDTVEDCDVTHDDIKSRFGPRVSQLVYELTNVAKKEDGNRAARMAIDRAFMAKASPEAKTIRLADIYDNLKDITQADPGFARIYMKEKRLMMNEALMEGDSGLYSEVQKLIDNYYLERNTPDSG